MLMGLLSGLKVELLPRVIVNDQVMTSMKSLLLHHVLLLFVWSWLFLLLRTFISTLLTSPMHSSMENLEEIYMKQPEGFEEMGPDYVCRLQRSIYGLKQAGRVWNQKLHSVFTLIGFK